MRRAASQARAHPVGHVNVTPMIDVVMVLIIFYLIVGRLVMERRGQVDLPETRVGEKLPEESDPLVITITSDGFLRLDGELVLANDLPDLIAARAGEGRRVRIRGDRGVAFRSIRPVVDACRKAGITSIELAAEQAP
ncbi:MAG: biopolymer transporter ExbD [Leptolyngbya sp. PLA3]|nr:MAG: biopolymer transporter ExbD [Cyanobacteria bacterium CYA]MCE7969992.1 biopolymer transporter ExbD [Leptolyngbya sp. PL-A3]